jgi:hypothetical protein
MKFESREVTVCPACGYTTRIFSGPSTTGIAGSAGALTAIGFGAGAGAGAATGTGVRAQPTRSAKIRAGRSVMRMGRN